MLTFLAVRMGSVPASPHKHPRFHPQTRLIRL